MKIRLTFEELLSLSSGARLTLLEGLYEHSNWIVEHAWQRATPLSAVHLLWLCTQALEDAGREAKLQLIRAHPELAGKAMVAGTLTQASTQEQSGAGLTHCSPEEFAHLQNLNQRYAEKFAWPFILAVKGPRGTGLSRQVIIQTFERRLSQSATQEFDECIRQIHRIAQVRLADRIHVDSSRGVELWDAHEQLAQYTDVEGTLTALYLQPAHQNTARHLVQMMQEAGFDDVFTDDVGNVVGRWLGKQPHLPALMMGSHYDTVRNAGKYDGRLGILAPIACVKKLNAQGIKPHRTLELVAFAEEEGQRFPATLLASSALTGQFDPAWLEQTDAEGINLRDALLACKLNPSAINQLKRDPKHYLGFLEIHIEQGPVLQAMHLPLAVVTSINGAVRLHGAITGTAAHAGTTPMNLRHDALCALSEWALRVEAVTHEMSPAVATIGIAEVPMGSINVVPGQARFTLDVRAPQDALRDALLAQLMNELQNICNKRGVQFHFQETYRAPEAPCNAALQQVWADAIAETGLPVHRMPSGAGHDAMKMHHLLPQAMLFVRGENGGISHNPLESTHQDDMQLALEVLDRVLHRLILNQETRHEPFSH